MDYQETDISKKEFILGNYTPAETIFLANLNESDLISYLKYTFIDLLMKRVLKAIKIDRDRNGEVREYTYVETGDAFTSYQPLPHEKPFIEAFKGNTDMRILFLKYARMVYEKVGYEYNFIKKVSKTPSCFALSSRPLLWQVFGGISPNTKGKGIGQKLKQELDELSDSFQNILTTNPKEALRIMTAVRANIFLVSSFNLLLMQEVNRALKLVNAEFTENAYYYNDVWFWYGDSFTVWDNGSQWSEFDSGFSDAGMSDGMDSSGCGGGCSGCSGCGGCGGCGS